MTTNQRPPPKRRVCPRRRDRAAEDAARRPTSPAPTIGVSSRSARDGEPTTGNNTPPQLLHRQRLEVHAAMDAARQPTRQLATKGETARCDDCVRLHSPPTTARGAESTGQQPSTNNLPASLQPAA